MDVNATIYRENELYTRQLGCSPKAPVLVFYWCCNKLPQNDFRKHKYIILQFWRSESKISFTGIKSRCWQKCLPSGGPSEGSIPVPFQASRSHLPSLICDSFLHPSSSFKVHHSNLSFVTSPFLTLILLPPFYNDPCNYVASNWIVKDNLPVLRTLT